MAHVSDPVGTLRRPHGRARRAAGSLLVVLLSLTGLASSARAAPVPLGTADSFAVLAASTVTNTGPSVITGDLGLSPGTAVTGFPPGTVTGGRVHATDAVALQAQNDLVTAYNDAAARASTAAISADLAGRTLTPGVYTSASAMGLSGALTLDARGDPNAVFVFQAGSTLTTGSASRVVLTGGAQACNVFWQVGSSATIGTASAFAGNILALASVTLTTGATLNGRALARTGAVTLDTNTVTKSTCATQTTAAPPAGPPGADGRPGGSSPSASPSAGRATARLSGPSACVDAAFVARVRGRRIAQVAFSVDGRFRRTVRAVPGRTVFSLRVDPGEQSPRVHRITARVRFTPRSGARTRTLRFAYRRCAAAETKPRFTG
jgi:ice-binding like protein